MNKNFSTLLQKSPLTPLQRAVLLIKSDINKRQKGASLLTEKEQYALGRDWKGKDKEERRLFNLYYRTWIHISDKFEMDIQTTFLEAEIKFQNMRMLSFFFTHEPYVRSALKSLENLIPLVIDSNVSEKYKQSFVHIRTMLLVLNISDHEGEHIGFSGQWMKIIVTRVNEFMQEYENLLAIQTLYKHFNRIYGVDISYRIDHYLKELEQRALIYNNDMEALLYEYTGIGTEKEKKYSYISEEVYIRLKSAKPNYDFSLYKDAKEYFFDFLREYPLPIQESIN